MADMFERASRLMLRFPSPAGSLSVEDLWKIPLTSKGATSIDNIARETYNKLRDSADSISFVNPAQSTAESGLLQLRMDLLKHIIEVRVAERDEASALEQRRQKKQEILEVIASKERGALEGQSLEDLRKMAENL